MIQSTADITSKFYHGWLVCTSVVQACGVASTEDQHSDASNDGNLWHSEAKESHAGDHLHTYKKILSRALY